MGAISFGSLANGVRIPEIRKKLLFTAMMLIVYRFGSHLPVPGVSHDAISDFFNNQNSNIFNLLNLWTGGGLGNAAIFGLGIMPYITASIIMQLMTVVIPALAQLQKEGEMGYQRINRMTRYLTVVLALVQSFAYFILFQKQNAGLLPNGVELGSWQGISHMIVFAISLTAGTTLLMWIGELITQRGIGNGISLIIFASILSRSHNGIQTWLNLASPVSRVMLVVLVVAITTGVVFIQEGQRRIPVQYAKRVVGRRMTQGGSTYLPLRVNMAGVIPIIFAAAIMAFPATLAQFGGDTLASIGNKLSPNSGWGIAFEAILVVAFTYFYTAVQFNPVDQADNLKKYGGFIPGVRPGAPTASYLSRVLTRLTLPGSLYLAALVVLPTILISLFGLPASVHGALGGTTILIVVGVALDSMRQMESQLVLRNYEGFLK